MKKILLLTLIASSFMLNAQTTIENFSFGSTIDTLTNPANGGVELFKGVKKYIDFYNKERRHDSLSKETPNEYYHSKISSS